MENELILLNKVGLTDAEGKVYLALLQSGSLSGYEASKVAGVPRSKIYNILESLIKKGFILYTEYESNNKYAAIPMTEVADRLEDETKHVLSKLTNQLSMFPQQTNLDYIWHIRTNGNVFAKCRDIIRRTKRELLLQIWKEDLVYVLEDLQKLEAQNVQMGIVVFGVEKGEEIPLKRFCRHGLAEKKKQEMGGRWITLVSEMKEVVFGQIISDSIAEVIWTQSKPMISLAAECVRHDMYFYKSADKFGDVMHKEYGDDLEGIRNIF